MAVDALLSAGALPEPAILTFLNSLQEVLANLSEKGIKLKLEHTR